MKVLFADKFPETYLEEIEQRGYACVFNPELTGDDLPRMIDDYDALVVRSTRVTADTLNAANSLKLVVRAGAGTNTIDKQAATAKGVYVCNVPGKNAIAVAELTLGLLISIDRNIPDNVADIRNGKWDKKRYSETRGLYGRSIGIVGLGAIGMAVAERAHAFGLSVHVIRNPNRSQAAEARLAGLGVQYVNDLNELAEVCDILSFHVPAADNTKGLIGRELLARLKPGAIIINTSRGDIVDEQALIEAMEEKGVRVGLDVYVDEPGTGKAAFDSALAKHPNVYGTHHIGASTAQAQNAVAEGVVEILDAFANGKVLNCVNIKV
ncbi:MAG: NAD(P)-dependent oxidoreductase [Acidiferrobacterales bacterium]